MKTLRFPSIRSVAHCLTSIGKDCRGYGFAPDLGEDTWFCDVRLHVWPDGSWAVHSGDSQYDQDHRGFWGASSIPGTRRFNARDVARELIDQAKEHHALERVEGLEER